MRAVARRIGLTLSGPIVTVILVATFPPTDRTESLVQVAIGLVISVLSNSLADGVLLRKQLETVESNSAALNALIGRSGLGSAATRLFLQTGNAKISAEEYARFYFRVLWAVERSYHTTFVGSAKEAGYGYNEEALQVQGSKVAPGGVDIRRIFICGDDDDARGLLDLMLRQVALGIKVRYITRDLIGTHQLLKAGEKKVGELDFAIIDGALTFITHIDSRTYKIRGATLSSVDEVRAERESFYQLLWAEAKSPSSPHA